MRARSAVVVRASVILNVCISLQKPMVIESRSSNRGARTDPTLLQDHREYSYLERSGQDRGLCRRRRDYSHGTRPHKNDSAGNETTCVPSGGGGRRRRLGSGTHTLYDGHFYLFFFPVHNIIIIISLRFSVSFYVTLHIIILL